MKKITSHVVSLAGALILAAIPSSLQATPYASGCTNVAGTVTFYLNESGGNVTVTYEDGSTNASWNGITTGTNVTKGPQTFSMGDHTGYAIQVFKIGNGTPSQISVDATPGCLWPSPRGVAVNKNPQNARLFGRVYADNSSPGNSGANAKGRGLYAFNPDLTEALGNGVNAAGTGGFTSASSSSPYHIRVAPDNTLLVGDFSTANACLRQFAPDLTTSNLVLGIIGENAAVAAGLHGDMFGTAKLTGSLAQSNLVLWVGDGGMAVPPATQDPTITLGPGTGVGQYNNIYRYDIGHGPLPWTNGPNYAYNVGLSSIAELNVDFDIGKDGKIIAMFDRGNLSNPDVQIVDSTGQNLLWTSWNDTGGNSDPWAGQYTVGSDVGLFGGIRVSPDGVYLAGVDVDNGITIANLTNGIPDDSTLFGIQNASNVGNARGMDWDAADNIYVISSGQGLLRVYSLGLTTTCITSNDITGTNGTFQLILPPVTASVLATTNIASQNYVNNTVSPGTPIPGQVTFTLSTNTLPAPVVLNYLLTGSAVTNLNFTISTGTNADGVSVTTSNLVFPAGTYPHGGNWSASLYVTPTAIPVSGPSLTVGFTILGGAQNVVGSPAQAIVSIQNTGPQLIFVTNNASIFGGGVGNTMSRSVPGDYCKFRIIRWGDTNGPGNNSLSVNPTTYTVTNFLYSGTAVFPTDYTAQAQRSDPAFNGIIQSPTPGSPGVVINPGDTSVIAVIGDPVAHSNIHVPPVNLTINLSATNTVFPYTNCTSSEGYAYSVVPTPPVVSFTEFDNALGAEVVLWSDPLTNALDSTNWTLAYASTNFAAFPVAPVIIPNYTNDETALVTGGTNDFRAEFGVNTMVNDSVPQSAAMVQNGWTNALRMTVNQDSGFGQVCGVNLFPQNVNFAGNYALRFSMYLSLESSAIGNPSPGLYPYEFSLFAVNASGTNCIWRTDVSIPPAPGYAAPTNVDGVWFAIDAGYGDITPADFDAFTPPALPYLGGSDYQSSTALSQNGVFKSPPFDSAGNSPSGGEPVDQWVDVSVELTSHTNLNLLMDRSQVIPSFNFTNGGGNYVQGKPMLGYLQPNPYPSGGFVYYSNVRVVELAPYIYAPPLSLIVTQGANVSFSSSTWLATSPVTNIWYRATSAGVAVAGVQTNVNATVGATNLTSSLTLNNVQVGTNYILVASDPAGSESSLTPSFGAVASLEVIIGPTNRTVSAGSNTVVFAAIPSGFSAPSAYQWYTNGVALVNNNHFAGVTTGTLIITNAQLRDAVTYTVSVANAAGSVAPSATLTVLAASPTFSTVAISGTNELLNFTTTDPYDNTGSFTLQSSGVVNGPYTNVPGTTLTGGAEAFQFKVPYLTNSAMFYRLMHN